MKKVAFLALAFAAASSPLVGGCSSNASQTESTPAPAIAEGATSSQKQAFTNLETTTKQSWKWVQQSNDTSIRTTPTHLSAVERSVGERILFQGADPAATTINFMKEHKALFNMNNPAIELSSTKNDVDHLGMTHARFQQMVHGIPVSGAEVMAHYDVEGRITSIDTTYIANLSELDVAPKLEISAAIDLAKKHVLEISEFEDGAGVDESTLVSDEGKLVVYAPPNAEARLAYELRVRALEAKDPAIWVTTIDAKTGTVLHRYNNLQTIQGSGKSVLGETKTIEVAQNGTAFLMTDAANTVQIRTFTAKNVQTTPGTQITSTSATSWDTGVTGAGAAVDAHFNASTVFKYYKDHHARSAIDGQGGQMLSTVHFGQAYDNAAWDGSGMLYGDGGQMFKPLSASLDVVGHEFTHGVTEKTSNLVYETQSGALNEAVSDIFGAFIEHSLKPNEATNWVMGEEISKSGGPLRDMKNPTSVARQPQPAHMTKFVNTQQDNGGVHINSGIINNAAWLMTVGGTNPVSNTKVAFGIGWEKSEKLWFRANTKYFLQTTNFGAAAQGILQAAKDIGLTPNETNIVDCAFKATGVTQGACGTIVNPQSTIPTTPDDGSGTKSDGTGTDTPDTTESEEAEEPAPKPTKKTRKMAVVQDNDGCNASGSSSSTDLAPLAALAIVIGLIKRRRTQTN